MSDSILVALISSSSTLLTAIAAMILGYRAFTSLDQRMLRIEQRIDDLTGAVNDLDKRLIKVEIKLGIIP
jgi:hypothetical protein